MLVTESKISSSTLLKEPCWKLNMIIGKYCTLTFPRVLVTPPKPPLLFPLYLLQLFPMGHWINRLNHTTASIVHCHALFIFDFKIGILQIVQINGIRSRYQNNLINRLPLCKSIYFHCSTFRLKLMCIFKL